LNIGQAGIDTWYADELLARVCNETGAAANEVSYAFDVLEEHGWLEREDNLVWVKGHIADDPHMRSGNPKHRLSVQRHLAGLPRCGMVKRFCHAHPDWIPIDEATVMGLEWVFEGYAEASEITRKKTKAKQITTHDFDTSDASGSRYAFMGAMRTVWASAYGGSIPPGSAKRLEPLVREHGEEEVARRFANYCGATNARYSSVPRFVSTFGAWGSPPVRVDDSSVIGVGGVPSAEELEAIGIRIR